MNCWFGKTKKEFTEWGRQQKAFAAKCRSLEMILKMMSKRHDSQLKALKKCLGISSIIEMKIPDHVPTLEEAYGILGRSQAKLSYIERASMIIAENLGGYSGRFPCKEIIILRVNMRTQVSLALEMIWGLVDKEMEDAEVCDAKRGD